MKDSTKRAAIAVVALLAGCSTYEPRDQHWPPVPVYAEAAARPTELRDWPEPTCLAADGRVLDDAGCDASGAWIAFRPEQALDVLYNSGVAGPNYDIALAHAQQVDALREANRAFIAAGRDEFALAEARGQALAEERMARVFDKLLFGAMGIAGLLIGLN